METQESRFQPEQSPPQDGPTGLLASSGDQAPARSPETSPVRATSDAPGAGFTSVQEQTSAILSDGLWAERRTPPAIQAETSLPSTESVRTESRLPRTENRTQLANQTDTSPANRRDGIQSFDSAAMGDTLTRIRQRISERFLPAEEIDQSRTNTVGTNRGSAEQNDGGRTGEINELNRGENLQLDLVTGRVERNARNVLPTVETTLSRNPAGSASDAHPVRSTTVNPEYVPANGTTVGPTKPEAIATGPGPRTIIQSESRTDASIATEADRGRDNAVTRTNETVSYAPSIVDRDRPYYDVATRQVTTVPANRLVVPAATNYYGETPTTASAGTGFDTGTAGTSTPLANRWMADQAVTWQSTGRSSFSSGTVVRAGAETTAVDVAGTPAQEPGRSTSATFDTRSGSRPSEPVTIATEPPTRAPSRPATIEANFSPIVPPNNRADSGQPDRTVTTASFSSESTGILASENKQKAAELLVSPAASTVRDVTAMIGPTGDINRRVTSTSFEYRPPADDQLRQGVYPINSMQPPINRIVDAGIADTTAVRQMNIGYARSEDRTRDLTTSVSEILRSSNTRETVGTLSDAVNSSERLRGLEGYSGNPRNWGRGDTVFGPNVMTDTRDKFVKNDGTSQVGYLSVSGRLGTGDAAVELARSGRAGEFTNVQPGARRDESMIPAATRSDGTGISPTGESIPIARRGTDFGAATIPTDSPVRATFQTGTSGREIPLITPNASTVDFRQTTQLNSRELQAASAGTNVLNEGGTRPVMELGQTRVQGHEEIGTRSTANPLPGGSIRNLEGPGRNVAGSTISGASQEYTIPADRLSTRSSTIDPTGSNPRQLDVRNTTNPSSYEQTGIEPGGINRSSDYRVTPSTVPGQDGLSSGRAAALEQFGVGASAARTILPDGSLRSTTVNAAIGDQLRANYDSAPQTRTPITTGDSSVAGAAIDENRANKNSGTSAGTSSTVEPTTNRATTGSTNAPSREPAGRVNNSSETPISSPVRSSVRTDDERHDEERERRESISNDNAQAGYSPTSIGDSSTSSIDKNAQSKRS